MKKRTKKTLQIAAKVFVRLLVATILCAILYISMNVISTAFFSDVVGYQVYVQNENEEISLKTEHYYEAGEQVLTADDLDLADNEAFNAIREVSDNTKRVMDTISQILLLTIFCVFPYHILWEFGNRDDTNVRYRGQRPDPWRGFKIGLLSVTPYLLNWGVLVASKYVPALKGYLPLYRLTAFPYLPYTNWLLDGADSAVDVNFISLLLLVIPIAVIVPCVCAVAYRMGGRRFSIAEFLTFVKRTDDNRGNEEEI